MLRIMAGLLFDGDIPNVSLPFDLGVRKSLLSLENMHENLMDTVTYTVCLVPIERNNAVLIPCNKLL